MKRSAAISTAITTSTRPTTTYGGPPLAPQRIYAPVVMGMARLTPAITCSGECTLPGPVLEPSRIPMCLSRLFGCYLLRGGWLQASNDTPPPDYWEFAAIGFFSR